MKKNLILVVAFFLSLIMAVNSNATTYGVNVVQYHYAPTSGGISLDGSSYGGVYMRYGLNMTFTEVTPWYWPNGYYQAFCVDDHDAGSFNNGFLTELDASSPTRLKMASWLIYQYGHLANTDNGWAALQLAVWEAAFDENDLDLNPASQSGDTYYGGTEAWSLTARTYVSALASSGITWSTYTPQLTGFIHDYMNEPQGKQNFLVRPIPEPGTLLLLGSGLLGFGAIARYRRRK